MICRETKTFNVGTATEPIYLGIRREYLDGVVNRAMQCFRCKNSKLDFLTVDAVNVDFDDNLLLEKQLNLIFTQKF